MKPLLKKERSIKSYQKLSYTIRKTLLLILLKIISMTKEKMAYYAYQQTKFYQKLYAPLKELYQNIKKVSFYQLPLVHKKVVHHSNLFDLLSKKEEKNVFKFAETTGSTGSPTPSFYTKKEFLGSYLLSRLTPYSSLFIEVKRVNRRAVAGLACGFTIAGESFKQILEKLGFLTVNIDARTTIAPPHRVARLFSRFQPSVVAAAETDFLAWMKVLKEEYYESCFQVLANLQCLVSTAELCSENRSKQIARYFNLIHIDNYACVEGYFSLPCPCGEKHVLPIYEAEVLDETLQESSQLGSGRFAFTNKTRKSTPFVRYLLDDYITIFQSDCPFGFKKSIQPHGRYELTVVINGTRFGVRHFENLLFEDYLFGEYQIQLENDKIVIIAEDYQCDGKIPVDKIIANYEKVFGLKTEIKIAKYGELRNYKEVRTSKPLLRLQDKRSVSTQKIPEYL